MNIGLPKKIDYEGSVYTNLNSLIIAIPEFGFRDNILAELTRN